MMVYSRRQSAVDDIGERKECQRAWYAGWVRLGFRQRMCYDGGQAQTYRRILTGKSQNHQ